MNMYLCNIGRPVQHTDNDFKKSVTSVPVGFWGHITGFDQNASGEVLIKVTWQDKREMSLHPSLFNM